MEPRPAGIQMDLLDQQLTANLRGDFAEGWRLSQLLLAERPGDDRAAFNRGWHYMHQGDLQKGFESFEGGRRVGVFGGKPPLPFVPRWNGLEPLQGKTVLLAGEGGFGDEILNVRFAKQLATRGARVVVSCHPALMTLFERIDGVSEVVPHGAEQGVRADYYVPAMSAALPLGITFETLSGSAYMKPLEMSLAKWRQIIQGQGLKVGIRWSGNPRFEHEQHRRFPAEPIIAHSDIPGVTVYSLQRDTDLRDLPSAVIDLAPQLATWEDTAAAISLLDLVITSDTSINHLSGALGKETWTILPILPYYPWAQPGEKAAWYDSLKLFRQETFGNWDAPLQKVRRELETRAGQSVPVSAPSFASVQQPTPAFVPVPQAMPAAVPQPTPQAQSFVPMSSAPQTRVAPLVPPGMVLKPKPAARPLRPGEKAIHFVAGLPRCGSTALISLMAQNPRIHGAPISGLSGIFGGIHANWDKSEFHVEMPNFVAKRNVLLSVLQHYHETDRPVILDKDRQWVQHIGLLEELLQRPVKLIVPVRPLPEILASFEVLRRKTPLSFTLGDEAVGPTSTIASRAAYFASSNGALGMAYNGMKDAVTEGYLDRMLFVDYNKLTLAPKTQLRRIYDFLEEPYYEHDLERVEQIAHGDSRVHKFVGLHDIRPAFKKESLSPREVLGGDVVGEYDNPEPWAMWT